MKTVRSTHADYTTIINFPTNNWYWLNATIENNTGATIDTLYVRISCVSVYLSVRISVTFGDFWVRASCLEGTPAALGCCLMRCT